MQSCRGHTTRASMRPAQHKGQADQRSWISLFTPTNLFFLPPYSSCYLLFLPFSLQPDATLWFSSSRPKPVPISGGKWPLPSHKAPTILQKPRLFRGRSVQGCMLLCSTSFPAGGVVGLVHNDHARTTTPSCRVGPPRTGLSKFYETFALGSFLNC